MKPNRIVQLISKEITQYFHFPIMEILLILVTVVFSLNAFSNLSNQSLSPRYSTGSRLLSISPSPSEIIDVNINYLFYSLGLDGISNLPALLTIILTALIIGRALERGEALVMLSYPISRTEFILIKILTVLLALLMCFIMPIMLLMLSIFPIRSILIIGLLGWFLSIMEIIALTSLMTVVFRKSLPAILTTLFILFSIDRVSINPDIVRLKHIINPSKVLMNYFYPASLRGPFMNVPNLQDVLFSVGYGLLIFIGCIMLSMWRVKNIDVR